VALASGIIIGVVVIGAIIAWYLVSLLSRRTRTIITSISTVVMLILGGYVTYQYKDMQKSLGAGDKQFILVENGALLAAFATSGEAANVKDDLTVLRVAYAAGDLSRVRGDAASLLILTPASFERIGSINVSGTTLSRDEAFALLRSPTARDTFVATYANQRGINASLISGETLGTDDSLRGIVFATMIAELTSKENMILLLRNKQVRIEPGNIILRLLDAIPDALLPYFVGSSGAS